MSDRRKLYILGLCGFAEQVSYFGLFAVLVLSLHIHLHLTVEFSISVFSFFMASLYLSVLFGGYLADTWIGDVHSVMLGGVLLILGNVALISNTLYIFYLGLVLIILGASLFKVNCIGLVGKLDYNTLFARERGFIFFYACMNIGAFLSPLFYAAVIYYFNWRWCFIVGAIILFLPLSFFYYVFFRVTSLSKSENKILLIGMILCFGMAIYVGFLFINIANSVLVIIFFASICILIYLAMKKKRLEKARIFALFLLNTGCLFFFLCSFQVGSSISLFLQDAVNRVLWGWQVPVPVFTALDPLFVVLMAPCFASIWFVLRKLSGDFLVTSKMAIGMLMAAFAFFILYTIATNPMSQPLLMFLLVISYLLLGAGEICLVPAVLSALQFYAPASMRNMMMSSWYLFIAFAGYLAGQFSKFAIVATSSTHDYAKVFMYVALFALLATGLVLIFGIWVKRGLD